MSSTFGIKLMKLLKWLISGAFAVFIAYLHFYAVPCGHRVFSGDETIAKVAFVADPQIEGDGRIDRQGLWGRIDVALNDLYFRHIANSIARLRPTHAFMLGDLFSSQYISETEFKKRVHRFRWSWKPLYDACPTSMVNVTGNHDIGYGDYANSRVISRFEEAFGPVNTYFVAAEHMFVVVNSMTLDESQTSLRDATWKFVEEAGRAADTSGLPVVLVTHIPLYKENTLPGCDKLEINAKYGRIKDQTHLRKETSEKLFSILHPAIIFVGHDHNGCYYELQDGVSEYTVRSVMGDFGGNAQLFGIKKHSDGSGYEYAVEACPLVLRMRDLLMVFVLLMLWILYLVISGLIQTCTSRKSDHEHNE